MEISKTKNFFAPHWLWFFGLTSVYMIYDYVEHLTRPSSVFIDEPFRWFLFTLFSQLTLIGLSFGVSKILFQSKMPELIASTIGVAIAVFTHVTVSGPLWDRLFWFGTLYFKISPLPIVVGAIVYLVFRAIFFFISMLIKKIRV